MSEIDEYKKQFLQISANVTSHTTNPIAHIQLNWSIFNRVREEFQLNINHLDQLVAAAQENISDPQSHSAFAILQAAKLLTIEQALKESKCDTNYDTALSFYKAVPTYFCGIVGHNTCGLESSLLTKFAALVKHCTDISTASTEKNTEEVIVPEHSTAQTNDKVTMAGEVVEVAV